MFVICLVIQELINKGHQVFIATATDAKNLVWKEELLEKFFPFIPKENVIKIHKKELLKLDVLIDDEILIDIDDEDMREILDAVDE